MRVSEQIMRHAADGTPKRMATQALSKAKSTWGSAWSKLSSEMQSGAIALAAIYILGGQDTDSGKWTSGVELADAVISVPS